MHDVSLKCQAEVSSKMQKNPTGFSTASVVIGALRVNSITIPLQQLITSIKD